MKAYRFTTEQLVELVRAGLAIATSQGVRAGRERMEIGVLRITAEGAEGAGGDKALSTPIDQSISFA